MRPPAQRVARACERYALPRPTDRTFDRPSGFAQKVEESAEGAQI